jgi:hypothetical protein
MSGPGFDPPLTSEQQAILDTIIELGYPVLSDLALLFPFGHDQEDIHKLEYRGILVRWEVAEKAYLDPDADPPIPLMRAGLYYTLTPWAAERMGVVLAPCRAIRAFPFKKRKPREQQRREERRWRKADRWLRDQFPESFRDDKAGSFSVPRPSRMQHHGVRYEVEGVRWSPTERERELERRRKPLRLPRAPGPITLPLEEARRMPDPGPRLMEIIDRLPEEQRLHDVGYWEDGGCVPLRKRN